MENLWFAFVFLGLLWGVLPRVVSRVSCPWVGHTPQQRKDIGKLDALLFKNTCKVWRQGT